jgi:hypothetical protein
MARGFLADVRCRGPAKATRVRAHRPRPIQRRGDNVPITSELGRGHHNPSGILYALRAPVAQVDRATAF